MHLYCIKPVIGANLSPGRGLNLAKHLHADEDNAQRGILSKLSAHNIPGHWAKCLSPKERHLGNTVQYAGQPYTPIALSRDKTMTVKCVSLLFFKFICTYIFIHKYICQYLLFFYFKRYIRYTSFYCFVHLCWQSFHSVINNSLFFFKQLHNIPYCGCSISSNAFLTSFGMIIGSSSSLSDSQDSLN